jgi:hypothetical protein
MMRSTKHKCPTPGCEKMVPREKLMCLEHWRYVDDEIKRRVYAAYRNLYRGGAYEGEHRNACKAAIDDVRRKLDARAERGAQRGLDL